MAHPLTDLLRENDRLVLIGDSSEGRFPGESFHAYQTVGKPVYVLDLGGLTESRGRSPGHKVYTSVAELPDDRGELAVIWVKPKSAARAVDIAHEAGCTKVWFSFQTGHRDAVAKALVHGMEVVEIGRCPVYFLEGPLPPICKGHVALVKLSGTARRPPQTDPSAKRRELY